MSGHPGCCDWSNVVAGLLMSFLPCCPRFQVDIEDADDAERALTLSNPVLESLEK